MAINLGSCEIKRYKFYNGGWGSNFANGFQSGPNGTNNQNGGLLTCTTPTFSNSYGTELTITTTIVSNSYNNVTIYAYLYSSDPGEVIPSGTSSLGDLSYVAYGTLDWSGKSAAALDFSITLKTVNSNKIESNKTYYIWITTNNFVAGIDYKNSFSANLYGEQDVIDTYTIKYNANGGTGTISNQIVNVGDIVTIKENSFIKTGHSFIGWTTNSDGSDDGHNWTDWSGTWKDWEGQYGIFSYTLTLYARWQANKLTITYYGNEATSGTYEGVILSPIEKTFSYSYGSITYNVPDYNNSSSLNF